MAKIGWWYGLQGLETRLNRKMRVEAEIDSPLVAVKQRRAYPPLQQVCSFHAAFEHAMKLFLGVKSLTSRRVV